MGLYSNFGERTSRSQDFRKVLEDYGVNTAVYRKVGSNWYLAGYIKTFCGYSMAMSQQDTMSSLITGYGFMYGTFMFNYQELLSMIKTWSTDLSYITRSENFGDVNTESYANVSLPELRTLINLKPDSLYFGNRFLTLWSYTLDPTLTFCTGRGEWVTANKVY